MDNQFEIDLADIVATIRAHDVVAIRFLSVGQRLLLDFRSTEIDGPVVRVVEPVKSVEERYGHLKQIRPRFPAPRRIVAIWWPRFVSSMVDTGVWAVIMQRVSDAGHVDAVHLAEETLAELAALERKIEQDAIRGTGFKTLWTASPTQA
ncbi:MAG TPA: hypothetical protein VIK11_01105 [Tepidiformaceae bacterium]